MAGKTGTAQVRSYDRGRAATSGIAWRLKDHNLFVAFAPYDDPRYALSVIIEHGGQGGASAAAPRAREVMRVALLKDPEIRARIERPMPLPDGRPRADGFRSRAPRPTIRPTAPPLRRPPPVPATSASPEFLDDPQRRPDPARRTRPADHQVHGDRLDVLSGPVPDRRRGRPDAVFDRRRLVGALGRQAPDALRDLFGHDGAWRWSTCGSGSAWPIRSTGSGCCC
jgi:hypothetical protein